MALIECPECKRDLSDSLKKCPHCGYKIPLTLAVTRKSKIGRTTVVAAAFMVLCLVTVLTVIALASQKDNVNTDINAIKTDTSTDSSSESSTNVESGDSTKHTNVVKTTKRSMLDSTALQQETQRTTTPSITKSNNQQKSSSYYKSIIRIAHTEVSRPNSADGVDFTIFWNNKSNKIIKYITFSVEPYNAVGDKVTCDIRNYSRFNGQVTGPIKKIMAKEDIYGSDNYYYYYDKIIKEWALIVGEGNEYLRSDDYGLWEWVTLTNNQLQDTVISSTWDCAWYNNTIKSIKIIEIEIIYMDGSREIIAGSSMNSVMY